MVYLSEHISENIATTPEGFLICQHVPICRHGALKYKSDTLGIDDTNQWVTVIRDTESYSTEFVNSINGKPFTDDHPYDFVRPDNWKQHSCGHLMNATYTGEIIYVDIFINDKKTIAAVLSGKRQVSIGVVPGKYKRMGNGTYHQTLLALNHVALVHRGRAGEEIAIQDAKEVTDMSEPVLTVEETSAMKKFLNMFSKEGKVMDTSDTDNMQKVLDELKSLSKRVTDMEEENKATKSKVKDKEDKEKEEKISKETIEVKDTAEHTTILNGAVGAFVPNMKVDNVGKSLAIKTALAVASSESRLSNIFKTLAPNGVETMVCDEAEKVLLVLYDIKKAYNNDKKLPTPSELPVHDASEHQSYADVLREHSKKNFGV